MCSSSVSGGGCFLGGLQVITGRLHLHHLVVKRDVTTHSLIYLEPHGAAHTLDLARC